MGMVAAGHALLRPGQPREQAGAGAARAQRPGQPRTGRDPGAARRRRRRVPHARSRSSATGWSRTWCSTAAASSSPTPGSRRPTRAGRRGGCAASPCTATPPARPTSSACRSATRGRTTTAAGRWCSTATPRRPSRSGSTTRCAWTPAACSAASSPRCATRRRRSSPSRPSRSGTSRPSRSSWPRRRVRRRRARTTWPSPTCWASAASRPGCAGRVTVREENAAGALEVMSRFALDPRWLLYLPPTMAPSATVAARRPAGASRTRRSTPTAPSGVDRGRSARRSTWAPARSCWSAATPRSPATGSARRRRDRRRLHPYRPVVLRRPDLDRGSCSTGSRGAVDRRRAVGRARHRLAAARLRAAALVGQGRGPAAPPVRGRRRRRRRRAARRCRGRWQAAAPRCSTSPTCSPGPRRGAANADAFTDAYRRYVWPTDGLDGVQLAPFQVLATEGAHLDRPRPRLAPGARRPAGRGRARRWSGRPGAWSSTPPTTALGRRPASPGGTELTAAGGEGMVVKPLANLVADRARLAQPGIKVRGPRVPADHLRPRLHRAGQPRPAA